jgi:translocation and assembly module TamB
LIARDDVAATVTGPLTFRSDGRGGVISGEVVLDRARYRLGRATAATAAPRINVREINAPPGAQEDEAAPREPWTMALRARGPGGVLVTGLGLNSEWAADLEIGGEPQNPVIRGRATLVRGDYEFAGREFDLERGVIRFGGETPANPALDIQADANASGLNAAIRVTGTALRPQIAFTSTPALPQDELCPASCSAPRSPISARPRRCSSPRRWRRCRTAMPGSIRSTPSAEPPAWIVSASCPPTRRPGRGRRSRRANM